MTEADGKATEGLRELNGFQNVFMAADHRVVPVELTGGSKEIGLYFTQNLHHGGPGV
ncbi:MAG TPA: hypothetical protein VMF06_18915 [Candidatus Limnocylindria bacterium]|jgi:hypothetical protein|nr:hypothetical protein [Candidatus Limnocylindria bacterium]